MEVLLMSIRIAALVVATAILGTLAVVVSSRQAGDHTVANPAPTQTAQEQQQSNPSPPATTNQQESAETPKAICTLRLPQAPDIRGVKLGLTVAEVLALFPGSTEDNEVRSQLARPANLGMTSFLIRTGSYASKEKFAGIKMITFTFLDGRVSNFNVGYDGPEWKHVDEFVTKFSEGTNLPALDAWEAYVGLDNQLKTLKCGGFEINVFAGGKGLDVNYVQMRDMKADKELKARRAEARKKAEQQSTP
jgi:hypothetical protein